jgi:hypothetical protein
MSAIGTLWDKSTGNTIAAIGMTAVVHSLAQAPDVVIPIANSISGASALGALYAFGSNASVATIGAQQSTGLAMGPIAFTSLAIKVHTLIS